MRFQFARTLCLVSLVLTGLTACLGDSDGPSATSTAAPTDPSQLSMQDIYDRVDATLARSDVIYRFAIATHEDSSNIRSNTTLWTDAATDTARREVDAIQGHLVTISTPDGQFSLDPSGAINLGDNPECPGGSVVAAAVLDCPNATFETYTFPNRQPQAHREQPTITIAAGTYEAHPVVVLTAFKRQQPFRSDPFEETRTLYLDPTTFFPRAIEVVRDPPYHTLTTYTVDTVQLDTLAASFFDPTALHLERENPEDVLDQPPHGLAAMWLGAQFTGGADAPSLVLWYASRYRPGDQAWDGDQVLLEYTLRDDPYGQQRIVRLTEYTRAVWDSLPPNSHGPFDHCWTEEHLSLPSGEAVVFSGFNWPDSVPPGPDDPCPSHRPPDRFFAHVFFEDAVVVVDMWDWQDQTRAALEAFVRGLQPRVP